MNNLNAKSSYVTSDWQSNNVGNNGYYQTNGAVHAWKVGFSIFRQPPPSKHKTKEGLSGEKKLKKKM